MPSLLVPGNGKLGATIHHFDLPPVKTCPGRTPLCEQKCYARQGNFAYPSTLERLEWCLTAARRPDFVKRMLDEIRACDALVVRVHVAGDFYGPAYARKWHEVMRRRPRVRFYFYTRSWRRRAIAPWLERMAALKNCRAWYSLDRETGAPERVPPGVRLAYMQVDADDRPPPETADLLFRVQKLRKQRRQVGLPMICPHEAPQRRHTTCASCGHCWV